MKKTIKLTTLTTTLAPIVASVSCSGQSWIEEQTYLKSNDFKKNAPVVAQSFHPIDFLASLGKKPDFYTNRSDQGIYLAAFPDYLKKMAFKNGTANNFDDVKQINKTIFKWGGESKWFNTTELLKDMGDEKGVLLTYQSIKNQGIDKIKKAFSAAVFDDMGDESKLGTYNPQIKLGNNYIQDRMYDVTKNYKLFAKAIDEIYETNIYEDMATKNIELFKKYCNEFYEINKLLFANKKILFVRPNQKVTDQSTADDFAIWTPLAYNLFYAQKDKNGMKMQFPMPKDLNWPRGEKKGGYFDPWAINSRNNQTANVSEKITEMYGGKADIVVYLTSDEIWKNASQDKKDLIEKSQSKVSKLLKDTSNIEDKIIMADYDLFYRGMYGILGQQKAIKEMASEEWRKAFGQSLNLPVNNKGIETKNINLSKLSK